MDILNEFYTALIQCLCMHVDYSDVAINHAIENSLHKQQFIITLARIIDYKGGAYAPLL